MRYYGFATRDYLILRNLHLKRELCVMEIGVGAGSTAEQVINKVKEFYGIDMSVENIDQLTSLYKGNTSVKFCALDVCKDIDLGKRFDILYSADTLEHVEFPAGFFNCIARHLSPDGMALVTFPNESETQHHGITWFTRKEDLVTLIDKAGLAIKQISCIKKTVYHKFIEYIFWKLPKTIMSRPSNGCPQSFEDTQAFAINKGGGIKKTIFTFYARIITKFAAFFPLYQMDKIDKDIINSVLLISLKLKINSK